MTTEIDGVIDYHQATKHRFERYAEGPGYLDWANQPEPFRSYLGAPTLPLTISEPVAGPDYGTILNEGAVPPAAVTAESVAQLLRDSLSLSAWKQAGLAIWPLRVNPSSGNLHPTEAYLLAGPIPGLATEPFLAHYQPRHHHLERRALLPPSLWSQLSAGLPPGALLMALTSIPWREAWKYGERAFRYTQHDIGHALAALAFAAAGLGWRLRLLEGWGHAELTALLGLDRPAAPERELPDLLLALLPAAGEVTQQPPPSLAELAQLDFVGEPNRLSDGEAPWPRLQRVLPLCRKPAGVPTYTRGEVPPPPPSSAPPEPLRPLLHRRRSAVAMDGRTALDRATFLRLLGRLQPCPGRVPYSTLPWAPELHLMLFVHRVEGLAAGRYLLLRQPAAESALRQALGTPPLWQPVADLPGLLLLEEGDFQAPLRRLSCDQRIASDGAFAVAMVARFRPALSHYGPWFYPRLFWEAGAIGQQLYLEAYAAGVAATGIGCYFDDPIHELIGLTDDEYQVLYHFTVGGAREDGRISTLPPYPGPEGV